MYWYFVFLCVLLTVMCNKSLNAYRTADKSLAGPGKKQGNVSARMTWISFRTLPCKKKKTWWQLASQCCWNCKRSWHASEFVSFLVGLMTYQHPGTGSVLWEEVGLQLIVNGASQLRGVGNCFKENLVMLEYHIFICVYFTSISKYYTGCLSNMRDAW